MKAKNILLVCLAFGFGATGMLQAKAKEKSKEKWSCMKDEAEVKVKGNTAEEKGKDCASQGGTWEKIEADKQSSGNGGGW